MVLLLIRQGKGKPNCFANSHMNVSGMCSHLKYWPKMGRILHSASALDLVDISMLLSYLHAGKLVYVQYVMALCAVHTSSLHYV